jgi:hypothetical protein
VIGRCCWACTAVNQKPVCPLWGHWQPECRSTGTRSAWSGRCQQSGGGIAPTAMRPPGGWPWQQRPRPASPARIAITSTNADRPPCRHSNGGCDRNLRVRKSSAIAWHWPGPHASIDCFNRTTSYHSVTSNVNQCGAGHMPRSWQPQQSTHPTHPRNVIPTFVPQATDMLLHSTRRPPADPGRAAASQACVTGV